MLGAEHAIRRPAGLKALVISNSPASMALWSSEAKMLARTARPGGRRRPSIAMRRPGRFNDPEYLAAQQVYYDLHVCRVVPNPPEVVRTSRCTGRGPDGLQRDERAERVLLHRNAARLERRGRGAQDHRADVACLGPIRRGRRRRRCSPSSTAFRTCAGRSSRTPATCPSSRSPSATSRSWGFPARTTTGDELR